MRNIGGFLFLVGIAGFFYCSMKMSGLPPVPTGLSISDALAYEAGRFQVGEYGFAMLGAMGVLLMMFPKGR